MRQQIAHSLARVGAVLALGWIGIAPAARAADGAAAAPAMKVGYVDLAKLFDNYQRTKASDVVLEKEGKEKETELQARMSDLKKLRQSLELLADDAREAKTREIEEKAEELQRFRNTTARDLQRERDKIAKEILTEIQSTLKAYAEANGYSLIMDSRSLLFGKSAHDVTSDVLALLNKRSAATPAAAR